MRLTAGRSAAAPGCAVALGLAILAPGCAVGPAVEPGERTVRIVRDGYGVPHVYADDRYGLYFGYGHAVAQDRLAQMEMARRSTQGLVAEVLGEAGVEFDRNTRTLFSPASIRRQLDALAPDERAVFDGYAAGINRWLAAVRANPDELMPRQFAVWGFEPGDWSAYDVAMIFIGTMNNRYGDFNTERENATILAELTRLHGAARGKALFDLLNPRFNDHAPTTIPKADWSRPAYDSLESRSAVHGLASAGVPAVAPEPPAGFSNVWLIGRPKARDAGAILLNGPQFGWFNPAYVYSVGLHGAGFDVAGNTPFGYPVIMFGHNRRIAWGSTWGAGDIVDLFALELDPDDPARYRYRGDTRKFGTRTETIRVRGGEPVSFVALRSVHGPVVDVDREAGLAYAKKRSWDGRELDTLLAWLRATRAGNWDEWKAEAGRSAINVNLYYADVDGNIGYFHGGHFPTRAAGHDNRLPAVGDGSMDWGPRQPVELANPHVLNASTGFLANWNNKPGHGVMNPDFFFYSWSRADRVDILNEALAVAGRVSPDDAWRLLVTSAYTDVNARYLLPLIRRAVEGSGDAALVAADRRLQAWNRQSRDADEDGYYDEPATGLFRRFVAALIERTLRDDLGAAYAYFADTGYPTPERPSAAGTNVPAGLKAIVESAAGRGGYDLFNGEPPEAVVRAALHDALAAGGEQPLAAAARPFLTENFLGVPQALESERLAAPVEQNRGTENNMIVLRPGAIEGFEVTPPGQSGFVAPDGSRSPHYDDQLDLYHRFGHKRIWFYPADVERARQSETTLTYRASPRNKEHAPP